MKTETKQLIKIITTTADKYNKSIDRILTEFVEASYQYSVTGTYSRDYSYLVKEHSDFMESLMSAMKKRPYFDYFSEIMYELGKFDKKKMCQVMTPPHLVNALTRMLNVEGKIGEITCGTGSFVLAKIESYVSKKGSEKPLELYINDLDNRLIKIAVVQCLFNLLVNNPEELSVIKIRAWNNNIITEYKKNGYIVYDNDPHLIQEPYVMRYMAFKQEEKKEEELMNTFKEALAIF